MNSDSYFQREASQTIAAILPIKYQKIRIKHGVYTVRNSLLISELIALANLLLSLGDSGLKISKVILGAMSYGSPEWQEWVLDEEHSLPLLEHAYKVGLNTWDTVLHPLFLLSPSPFRSKWLTIPRRLPG